MTFPNRRALNQIADSQRLSETAVLRRVAQLMVYQWTKVAETAKRVGKFSSGAVLSLIYGLVLYVRTGSVGAEQLEGRGYGRLVRLSRNFVNNLRDEMKKIDGGGRGYP